MEMNRRSADWVLGATCLGLAAQRMEWCHVPFTSNCGTEAEGERETTKDNYYIFELNQPNF